MGGYPDDLDGNRISRWARICTIAHIFDALTTRRSYKGPRASFESLRLVREEIVNDLDPEYLPVFIDIMGTQTAGHT